MTPKEDYNYRQIDSLIHSRIRLAIMTVLVGNEVAEFTFLKEKIGTTDGNLSTHLTKLEEAGYVNVTKRFVDKKPQTTYQITETGRQAFGDYISMLEKFIHP